MATAMDLYLPFDAGAGANVTESGWRSMMSGLHPDGPLITGLAASAWDGVLKPTAGAGRSVDVAAGRVFIQGHYGESTGTTNLTVPANATGSTRIDNIVARVDFVNNVIELDIVVGTTIAPALVQNSSVWEILLGTSSIANGGATVTVTDERRCVGYAEGTYTPTWRFGSTAVSLTAWSTARYYRRHGLVRVVADLEVSNMNSATGNATVSTPSDRRSVSGFSGSWSPILGMATVYEESLGNRGHGWVAGGINTTLDRVQLFQVAATGMNSISESSPYTTNAGDELHIDFEYEAAH